MNVHKHFPPHLSQLVFIRYDDEDNVDLQKMNGLDYELFLWLIYRVHQKYSKTNSLEHTFLYKDIKDDFTKTLDTNSIKKSLDKISELSIISNYLFSYDDKKVKVTKNPFEIEVIKNELNKSYGFKVSTTELFMSWFDNPKPKVDVNYRVMMNLTVMSKFLYLFLRDSYGAYKNTKRYRNVNIDDLKLILNASKNTTNSNFLTQMKKSIKLINESTDLKVGFKKVEELNPKSGNKEIKLIKFTIELDEMKLIKSKTKKYETNQQKSIDDSSKNSKENNLEYDIENSVIDENFEDNLEDDLDNSSYGRYIKSFEEYIEDEVSNIVKSRNDIENINSFSNGVRKKLLNDEQRKEEFSFYQFLEDEKSKLEHKIEDNQKYMIILRHGDGELNDNPNEVYLINNKFQFIRLMDYSIQTETISDNWDFIEDKMADFFYFDILRCTNLNKFRVASF